MSAERVAPSATCTGADFHTDSVTAAIAYRRARHWRSESVGRCESLVSWHDPASNIVMMSSGGAVPELTAAVHNSADNPIASNISRRTTPF